MEVVQDQDIVNFFFFPQIRSIFLNWVVQQAAVNLTVLKENVSHLQRHFARFRHPRSNRLRWKTFLFEFQLNEKVR